MRDPRLVTASAIALVLLLGGCASATTVDESDDRFPRDSLVNEKSLEWESYSVIDDTHVRVSFTDGSTTCFGQRIDVVETDEVVELNLVSGRIPFAPKDCTMIATEGTMVAETEAPIGHREISQQAAS